MVPAAVLAVDQVQVDVVPETLIPDFVFLLACSLQQGCRCRRGFGQGPVQAFAHHGPVVPVQGVNNAAVAIDIPAVQARAVKQLSGVFEQPLGRGQATLPARRFKVQQQAGPFKGVPRGFAERAEWVCRVVPVVVR